MMPLLPFWFKQRQCKAEPQGDNMLKVTGPNLAEHYLYISPADNGRWRAGLRSRPDGPDLAATEPEIPSAEDAWEAAFELFRTQVIV
jgi:hypothetical protein